MANLDVDYLEIVRNKLHQSINLPTTKSSADKSGKCKKSARLEAVQTPSKIKQVTFSKGSDKNSERTGNKSVKNRISTPFKSDYVAPSANEPSEAMKKGGKKRSLSPSESPNVIVKRKKEKYKANIGTKLNFDEESFEETSNNSEANEFDLKKQKKNKSNDDIALLSQNSLESQNGLDVDNKAIKGKHKTKDSKTVLKDQLEGVIEGKKMKKQEQLDMTELFALDAKSKKQKTAGPPAEANSTKNIVQTTKKKNKEAANKLTSNEGDIIRQKKKRCKQDIPFNIIAKDTNENTDTKSNIGGNLIKNNIFNEDPSQSSPDTAIFASTINANLKKKKRSHQEDFNDCGIVKSKKKKHREATSCINTIMPALAGESFHSKSAEILIKDNKKDNNKLRKNKNKAAGFKEEIFLGTIEIPNDSSESDEDLLYICNSIQNKHIKKGLREDRQTKTKNNNEAFSWNIVDTVQAPTLSKPEEDIVKPKKNKETTTSNENHKSSTISNEVEAADFYDNNELGVKKLMFQRFSNLFIPTHSAQTQVVNTTFKVPSKHFQSSQSDHFEEQNNTSVQNDKHAQKNKIKDLDMQYLAPLSETLKPQDNFLTTKECQPPQLEEPQTESQIVKHVVIRLKNGDRCLILQHPEQLVHFNGFCTIEVIYGQVEVLGASLNKKSGAKEVYSPRGTSLLYIKNKAVLYKEDTIQFTQYISKELLQEKYRDLSLRGHCAIIVCKHLRLPYIEFIENHISQIIFPESQDKMARIEFSLSGIWNKTNTSPLWEQVLENIQQDGTRTVVCGGKGVGKSIFLRYAINMLLGRFKQVRVVDLDPGQSEFFPPGCVSLVTVTKEILGPNYTHLQQADRLILAHINIGYNISHYLKCVKTLLQSLEHMDVLPTVVNFPGFTQDLGLDIAANILKMLQPTHLVEIKSVNNFKNYRFDMTSENVNQFISGNRLLMVDLNDPQSLSYEYSNLESLSSANNGAWSLEARQSREIAILSYFGQMMFENVKEFTSASITMYNINYSALKIMSLEGKDISALAVNGSLVALCSAHPGSNGLFITHGYGFVRGLDLESDLLVLMTPEPIEALENVSHLVLGSINTPPSLIMSANDVTGQIPYVNVGELSDFGQLTKRSYLPPNKLILAHINIGYNISHYLKCVKTLLQSLEHMDVLPTVVNFPGFTQDLGLDIAANILKMLQPTHLVEIKSVNNFKNYRFDMTSENVNQFISGNRLLMVDLNDPQSLSYEYSNLESLSSANNGAWSLEARQSREIAILSYFGQMMFENVKEFTSASITMYNINYSALKIMSLEGKDISALAVNGSLVALCSAHPGSNGLFITHGYVRLFFTKGFVRGLDLESDLLVLMTPEPIEALENVSHLVLGSINTPPSLIMSANDVTGQIPYVNVGELSDFGQLTKRSYLPPNK